MAGTIAPNKPVFYRSSAEILARADELGVNTGQFVFGCNRGVANGAIGVNTGDYDPKIQDFDRDTPHYGISASYIGKKESAEAAFENRMVGLPNPDDRDVDIALSVGYSSVTTAPAAPLETYGTVIVLTNYTGTTLEVGHWAWGLEAAGGAVVAPIVDAGGPFYAWGQSGDEQLLGSVVVGTDPDPDLMWTVLSGDGIYSFSDPTILNPIITDSTNGGWTTVVVLTVTPNDGPAVSDTASISSEE